MEPIQMPLFILANESLFELGWSSVWPDCRFFVGSRRWWI